MILQRECPSPSCDRGTVYVGDGGDPIAEACAECDGAGFVERDCCERCDTERDSLGCPRCDNEIEALP